ncbi:unnamed protein product [Caenorhabditis auriculariae]|uniref:Uncharacterized protein n=1 Tax=Caenorhabditis auriculariae TaxID=2777116 RepID=A0A8S1HJG9_9PELO|nr:unnamed protein product [Caenorhabditis auriculariae]
MVAGSFPMVRYLQDVAKKCIREGKKGRSNDGRKDYDAKMNSAKVCLKGSEDLLAVRLAAWLWQKVTSEADRSVAIVGGALSIIHVK